MKKKTVLVTGGAGFIGSHLCDLFVKKGFMVYAMDNLATGNIDNISHLMKEGNFIFIKQDVTNYIHVPGKLDYILHFASPASPVDYLLLPIPTLKVGALGTHKALGLAKDKKAVFLLASTSEVYGDPLKHPQDETYWGNVNPIGPRSVYDEAKRFAEAMTIAYHRAHGLNVKIVRIFNTYGPRMRLNDGRVIPNLFWQALKRKPMTIYGDGSQTRSFGYVSDLVAGVEKLLFSSYNSPVNIGNPNEMSINDLAVIIKRLSKTQSRLVFKPLPKDDPKVRKPDITLARRLLGWSPKVDIETGLDLTMKYFKGKI